MKSRTLGRPEPRGQAQEFALRMMWAFNNRNV